MKKKYLNSVLTLLLLIIWGGVIFKYFGSANVSVNNNKDISFIVNNVQDYLVAKDTFTLELAGSDPFGVSIAPMKKPVVVSKKTNIKTTKRKKKTIDKPIEWPAISYHGFVKGEKKSTRLILLKINNRLYRKRENEQVQDVKLINAYNDSLIVSLNEINKTIKRQ